jgi:hypothetical protein
MQTRSKNIKLVFATEVVLKRARRVGSGSGKITQKISVDARGPLHRGPSMGPLSSPLVDPF